ncbi:MAG: hypothetical protein WCB31_12280 [Nitrososphaeraceae archaeon]
MRRSENKQKKIIKVCYKEIREIKQLVHRYKKRDIYTYYDHKLPSTTVTVTVTTTTVTVTTTVRVTATTTMTTITTTINYHYTTITTTRLNPHFKYTANMEKAMVLTNNTRICN